VPVIIHDSFLSLHTVKETFYGGLVNNFTLEQLKKKRLTKGGVIPTLKECLHTLLYQTPLQTVWLDIKQECDLEEIKNLQQYYLQKAKSIGRDMQIYIGVPNDKILQCFLALGDHQQIPSLIELEPQDALNINAQVWAPQYTNGFQTEDVELMHAAGKKVFVWSLDNKTLVDLYITEGDFDGVVTNTPQDIAHWLYTSTFRKKAENIDRTPQH